MRDAETVLGIIQDRGKRGQEEEGCGPHRRGGSADLQPPHGTAPAAPGGPMRDLRIEGWGASPSHPQTRRPEQEREDPEPARANHDRQAKEDPGPMQEMPRGRPCRKAGRMQRSKKGVTGKPDDIERVTSGLAGGRRERGRKTTSPAAYPTTTPFLLSPIPVVATSCWV
jgi:hypothetical protein